MHRREPPTAIRSAERWTRSAPNDAVVIRGISRAGQDCGCDRRSASCLAAVQSLCERNLALSSRRVPTLPSGAIRSCWYLFPDASWIIHQKPNIAPVLSREPAPRRGRLPAGTTPSPIRDPPGMAIPRSLEDSPPDEVLGREPITLFSYDPLRIQSPVHSRGLCSRR